MLGIFFHYSFILAPNTYTASKNFAIPCGPHVDHLQKAQFSTSKSLVIPCGPLVGHLRLPASKSLAIRCGLLVGRLQLLARKKNLRFHVGRMWAACDSQAAHMRLTWNRKSAQEAHIESQGFCWLGSAFPT